MWAGLFLGLRIEMWGGGRGGLVWKGAVLAHRMGSKDGPPRRGRRAGVLVYEDAAGAAAYGIPPPPLFFMSLKREGAHLGGPDRSLHLK